MTLATDISTAQAQVPPRAVVAPHATNSPSAAKKAATQFESVFISQFLGSMFEGISTDGPFGGGQGEAMFRSMMLDEYGKQIEARGGIGLSAAITRQLLHAQETHTGLSGK
ncbi:MAG: rod-binding protein [Rhizomicrobium sp.]|jgi:Rod binding domain-containing protein